ncbi:hypothetical protein [Sphingopyxis flava]|uniref:Uncharacterized protein n=1 Tax=Sphingopyxis flava TaxID=1507287 RepID=A0A1T5F0V5_9SPHN|nr:hypothetical protein [Sphingopyxis flava]SKB89756.1 hypothetical protein SAMN06295937_102718 [Sphingopyxis flava]
MTDKAYDAAFTFKDNLAATETVVDGVHLIQVQNGMARVTLTVSRGDPPASGSKKPTGQKVVAARLVMPLNGMIELHRQLEGMISGLISQGVLQRAPSGGAQTLQ